MKTLLVCACGLFFGLCARIAFADTIQLSTPTTVNLPPSTNYCRAAYATTAPDATFVTGFSSDGNYVLGHVQSHFVCGTGGRGGVQYVYVCTSLQWDLSGNLVSENTPISSQLGGRQSLWCPGVSLSYPRFTPPSNSVVGNEFTNSGGYIAETVVEEICGYSACYQTLYLPTLITP